MDINGATKLMSVWDAEREQTRFRTYEISFRVSEFVALFRGSAIIANMVIGDALIIIKQCKATMDKRDISRSVIRITSNKVKMNGLIGQFLWANIKNPMCGFEVWEIVPLKTKKGNKRVKVAVQ